jgi:hypothetical protein
VVARGAGGGVVRVAAAVRQERRKKLRDDECGCGGGPVGLSALRVPTMTAPRISKVEARKRAHEATRRANEARAARDKANIDDAADFLVAVGKIAEVESWKKERLAQLRAQVDAEAAKRVAVHRAKAGAAVARMQGRGETLTTIAARTDVGIGVVRTMARHAPKPENPSAEGGSHALGGGGVDGGPLTAAGPYSGEPPADAVSA